MIRTSSSHHKNKRQHSRCICYSCIHADDNIIIEVIMSRHFYYCFVFQTTTSKPFLDLTGVVRIRRRKRKRKKERGEGGSKFGSDRTTPSPLLSPFKRSCNINNKPHNSSSIGNRNSGNGDDHNRNNVFGVYRWRSL